MVSQLSEDVLAYWKLLSGLAGLAQDSANGVTGGVDYNSTGLARRKPASTHSPTHRRSLAQASPIGGLRAQEKPAADPGGGC